MPVPFLLRPLRSLAAIPPLCSNRACASRTASCSLCSSTAFGGSSVRYSATRMPRFASSNTSTRSSDFSAHRIKPSGSSSPGRISCFFNQRR